MGTVKTFHLEEILRARGMLPTGCVVEIEIADVQQTPWSTVARLGVTYNRKVDLE